LQARHQILALPTNDDRTMRKPRPTSQRDPNIAKTHIRGVPEEPQQPTSLSLQTLHIPTRQHPRHHTTRIETNRFSYRKSRWFCVGVVCVIYLLIWLCGFLALVGGVWWFFEDEVCVGAADSE
jgi:hypothetical protein